MQTAPATSVPRATSPPLFLGEHRALDFLNTLAAPAGEVVEWVGTGEDLVGWLVTAQLVPAEVAQPWRGAAGARLDVVAGRARELREWFRGFVQRRAGRPLTRSAVRALEPLNRLLADDSSYPRIGVATGAEAEASADPALRWHWERRWRGPEALLQPIAHAMADLVCQADFRYVRRCERCTVWFLDVSRGHQRRWCSMAVCGNRAKAEAYRASARE